MSAATPVMVSPQIKNILFATDLSPCCDAALPYLRAFALKFGAKIHAVHVVPPIPNPEARDTMSAELSWHREFAAKEMDNLPRSAALSVVACEVSLAEDPIAETVIATARTHNADLIIMGTHGRRGLKELVFGSVAEAIIRMAPCPVISISPATNFALWKDGAISSVVFASDLSPHSVHTLRFAKFVAKSYHARLIAVHATDRKNESVAHQKLSEIVSSEPGIESVIVAERGAPADLILRTAHDYGAGLIVMGARQEKNQETVRHPWSVLHRVACQAACPVMTIGE